MELDKVKKIYWLNVLNSEFCELELKTNPKQKFSWRSEPFIFFYPHFAVLFNYTYFSPKEIPLSLSLTHSHSLSKFLSSVP